MYQVTLYDNLPPNILNIPYLRIIGRRTFNGVLWANEVITPGDGLSTRTLKLYKVIHRWPLNTVYTQSHTLSHDGTSFASVPTLIDRSDSIGLVTPQACNSCNCPLTLEIASHHQRVGSHKLFHPNVLAQKFSAQNFGHKFFDIRSRGWTLAFLFQSNPWLSHLRDYIAKFY